MIIQTDTNLWTDNGTGALTPVDNTQTISLLENFSGTFTDDLQLINCLPNFTFNKSFGTIYGFVFSPDITFSQQSDTYVPFRISGNIQDIGSIGAIYSIWTFNTFLSSKGTGGFANYVGFENSPQFSMTAGSITNYQTSYVCIDDTGSWYMNPPGSSGSTLHITTIESFSSSCRITAVGGTGGSNSTVTVTDRMGFHFKDINDSISQNFTLTVTRNVGMKLDALSIGTTVYGIWSLITASSNRYFIYSGGDAQSVFAGNVTVGSTTSPAKEIDLYGTLRLRGATSGYTDINSPAAGGDITLTLPSSNGTNGQFLQTDGSGSLTWGTPGTLGTVLTTYASNGGTGDFTTSSTTLVDVNGLTLTLSANKIYQVELVGTMTSSTAAGMKFQVTSSNAAKCDAIVTSFQTLSAGSLSTDAMAINTLGSAISTSTAFRYLRMSFRVVMDGTGGTVKVQVQKVTSGTATIGYGTTMTAIPCN